jgi:hypothetical protein
MRKVVSIIILFFTAALLMWCYATPANAQAEHAEDVYNPPDTVFSEIYLTDEGITAVDTSGYEWHYDFNQGTFVAGRLPAGEIGLDENRRTDLRTDELSIEERCTEEKRVRPFERSPVWVGFEEYVDDNIIAYDRVTVRGWVRGDIKSLNRVLVSSSGRVDGDIEAPEITIKDGAVVLGRVNRVSSPFEFKDITRSFSVDGVIVVLSFTAFFLFCGFLAVTLMPAQMASFGRCLSRYRVRSYLMGLLFLFLMPAIVLLVTVTIVGMIIVPLVPLIYVFAFVLGITSFGETLGRHISVRFLGGEKSRLFQSTLGILLLMSFWFVVALLLGANDDVSQGFGIFFLVVSILLSSYPVLGGVGSALLTRFGFREYLGWKDRRAETKDNGPPAPAPPPIPGDSPMNPPPPGPRPPSATPPPSSRIPEREE